MVVENVFEQISSLVRASDLLTPFASTLRSDGHKDDAIRKLELAARNGAYDPLARVSLVSVDGSESDWIRFDDLTTAERHKVGEAAQPIVADAIITADTTALAIVGLFERTSHGFFFVLRDNRLIGTLRYADMFKAPFRLCLFALTLELEETSLELLLSDAFQAIESLPPGRAIKAKEVHELRYNGIQVSPETLLRCTMFVDKGTVLAKQEMLGDMRAGQIRSLFKRAERVRNECAHPAADGAGIAILADKTQLFEFVSDCRSCIKAICSRIEAG